MNSSGDIAALERWYYHYRDRRAGDLPAAESLVRYAVELSLKCDAPQLQAQTLTALAVVLAVGGRHNDGREAAARAVPVFMANGDLVSARCRENGALALPGP